MITYFQNVTSRLSLVQEQVKCIKNEYNELERNYMKVEKERDELYNTFEHTITLVMRKNEYKNVQLENQIDVSLFTI